MGKRGKGQHRRNHDDGIQDAVASGAVVQLIADWDLGVLRGVRSDEDHEVAWSLSPARARQLAASLLRAANTCEPPTSTAQAIQRASVQYEVERYGHIHNWVADGGVVHCQTCGALTPNGATRQAPAVAVDPSLAHAWDDPPGGAAHCRVCGAVDSPEACAQPCRGERPLPATVTSFGGERHVVGYCCPRCLHFHSACMRVGVYGEWPDEERDLAHAREQADRCCRCHYCDAPVERAEKQRAHDFDRDAPSLRQCCATCYEPERAKALTWAGRCKAASDAAREAYEASLQLAADCDAALRLHDLMSELSETYYCAGWLTDLEHSLWAMVQGGDCHFGLGVVPTSEVSELRRLHERAGGWWAHFEGGPEHDSDHGNLGGGVRFVPTAAWLDMALSVPR